MIQQHQQQKDPPPNDCDEDDEDDEDENINTDWIQEYEKLSNVDNNYTRETMNSINVSIFYMDINKTIKTIITDKIALLPSSNEGDKDNDKDKNDTSVLSKDRLLPFILSKKVHLNTKYDLFDILYFNFPLESENFYSFLNKPHNNDNYLQIGTVMNDIHFEKSVFIFHEINTLYLFLIEKETNHKHRHHTLKSILKNSNHNNSNHIKKHLQQKTVRIASKVHRAFTKKRYNI